MEKGLKLSVGELHTRPTIDFKPSSARSNKSLDDLNNANGSKQSLPKTVTKPRIIINKENTKETNSFKTNTSNPPCNNSDQLEFHDKVLKLPPRHTGNTQKNSRIKIRRSITQDDKNLQAARNKYYKEMAKKVCPSKKLNFEMEGNTEDVEDSNNILSDPANLFKRVKIIDTEEDEIQTSSEEQ